ncbi:MAG TPA: hypothetical protein VH482_32935 [Thermomicrobiales bacterium]
MANVVYYESKFHTYGDAELVYKPKKRGGVDVTKEKKHYVVQERDVSYRLYPHFHPYVTPLVQRLLRASTAGLQAADTEYAPGSASLPGSVEVALKDPTSLAIAAASPFTLDADVQGTHPDGTAVTLNAKLRLRLSGAANGTAPGGTRVLLNDGLERTPLDGSDLPLTAAMDGGLLGETKVTFAAAVTITDHQGVQVTIPAGTAVWLPYAGQVTIPNGTAVTILGSDRLPKELYDNFFTGAYLPTALVTRPYPVKDLDFTYSGAYSVYNWELFFHVPLTIAIHLSKNQRFAEAQRWFHFLFDPTDDSDGPTPERFWKVRPFQTTDVKSIEEILVNLATGADPQLRDETIRSIEAWKDAPFRPHVVARFRQQAYMFKTVMAYLDNLIAWGDSLFRQDTGEAIDEALMLYVLAANILGPRPQPVPKKGTVRPQTYDNLRSDLKQFGVVVRDMEADIPFDLMPFPADGDGANERLTTLRSLGKALYFCVPQNDNLLTYWDTVADRLFKIRNSLNIQGIFRQLALFEPPIDPAMLARATAAGLDVSAIVNGLRQPLPLVRFQVLLQKAVELCQEVKTLGGGLLAAMEKEDGEALSILRARHERVILEMGEHVRYAQYQEAIKSREGLLQSLAVAVQRYAYYERQLGRSAEEIAKSIPELVDLDTDGLAKLKTTFKMEEPAVTPREIAIDIAQDLGDSGGKIVSSHEAEELAKSEEARTIQDVIKGLNLAAQGLALIPDFAIDLHFWGLGGNSEIIGGKKLSDFTKFGADLALAWADRLSYEAGRAAKIATYARREQDWAFQSSLAAGEITQIFKQLRASQLREAIAQKEWSNHQQQIRHAEEIEYFLSGEKNPDWRYKIEPREKKATNKGLYTWLKREAKGLYGQCFQFAFDTARKAERALQHELGDSQLSYLQFGYLDGKEGLLAGERLFLDLKRMEMAYLDLNRREYELTKHVSLLQVDPLALLRLRATGRCTVKLPEALFDLDGPGHYFRRLKSVAVSIPCVTGPYSGVNCTLTLLKSSIRTSQVLDGGYARDEENDDERFDDYFGSLQSIVTSSGQNDSGLFETNLRDERFLPFEHSGVIGEWQLQLPADPSKGEPCQFDYETISDVILHLRYTAREGGELLRQGAKANLVDLIESAKAAGSVRLFSVRHEFPTEWAKFLGQDAGPGGRFALSLNLRPEHYPFWSQGRLDSVARVELWARSAQDHPPATLDVFTAADALPAAANTLTKAPELGGVLVGKLSDTDLPASPVGDLKLYFADKTLGDLWVAVTWA